MAAPPTSRPETAGVQKQKVDELLKALICQKRSPQPT